MGSSIQFHNLDLQDLVSCIVTMQSGLCLAGGGKDVAYWVTLLSGVWGHAPQEICEILIDALSLLLGPQNTLN